MYKYSTPFCEGIIKDNKLKQNFEIPLFILKLRKVCLRLRFSNAILNNYKQWKNVQIVLINEITNNAPWIQFFMSLQISSNKWGTEIIKENERIQFSIITMSFVYKQIRKNKIHPHLFTLISFHIRPQTLLLRLLCIC